MVANINLITLFNDSLILKQYAVWLKLKGVHSNGRTYNYSAFKFAKQSGLSRTLINKYMPFFIENGWVRREKDSIVFISKEKLRLKYGVKVFCDIPVDTNRTIGEIVNDLRFQLFKERERRWEHQKQLHQDQSNPSNLKAYKKAIKVDKVGEIGERYAVSLFTLAKQVNLSISSVSRLIKPRCKEKWNRVLCLGVGVIHCENYYNYSGKVFKVIMNEYSF